MVVVIITVAMYLHIKQKYESFNAQTNQHNLEERLNEKLYLASMKVLIKFLISQTLVGMFTNGMHLYIMSFGEYRFPNLPTIKLLMLNNACRVVNYTVSLPLWLIFDEMTGKIVDKIPVLGQVAKKLRLKLIGEPKPAATNIKMDSVVGAVKHNVTPEAADDILNSFWALKTTRNHWLNK